MSLENLVWELKYRPSKIDECILPEKAKTLIKDMITSKNIPNMLFDGPSGIGKTTVAKAIANEVGADLLFVNASLDGNMDTLRTTITQFVSTVSMSESSSKKIVLLDEADYLTANTQVSLRGFCDEFSENAIFILTSNFKNRIIENLRSRLTEVSFLFPKEEKKSGAVQMMKRACYILDKEYIEYSKESVAGLVSKNYPDFRQTILQLQKYSSSGKIDSGILMADSTSSFVELLKAISDKNFNSCRQWVANNNMDATTFYRGLYDALRPVLVPQTLPPVIMIIADYQFKAAHSVDKEINQTAALISIMQTAQFKDKV